MPRYIVLINFTEQGIKKIKDLPRRIQSAHEAVEKLGGKFVEWNLTMGQYDAVAIAEGPDEAAVAALILNAGKKGNIRTTTLKAFTEAEAAKIIGKIP